MIAVSSTITETMVLRDQIAHVGDRVRNFSQTDNLYATATVSGFLPTGEGRLCIQVVVRPDHPADPSQPEEVWDGDQTMLASDAPQS